MSDFLYWLLLTFVTVSVGWFAEGINGMIFLAFVCLLAGVFLILENKIHAHLEK